MEEVILSQLHLSKSGKAFTPHRGDIFQIFLEDVGYLARVIKTGLQTWPGDKHTLVYAFATRTDQWDGADRTPFAVDKIIGPPLLVGHPMYQLKYMEFLANLEVDPGEEFATHCFVDAFGDQVSDEYGNRPVPLAEPVGSLGSASPVDVAAAVCHHYGWVPDITLM